MWRGRQKLAVALILALPLGLAKPVGPGEGISLFGAVRHDLSKHYFGYHTAALPSLLGDYQLDLQHTCAAAATRPCSLRQVGALIDSLLQQLGDPHTFYLTAAQLLPLEHAIAGSRRMSFGISTIALPSGLWIAQVQPGGPAAQAGLQRGDLIVELDGEPATQSALTRTRLDGKSALFTVEQLGKTFLRQISPRPSNSNQLPDLAMLGDLAYLQIPSFTSPKTAETVSQLVARAEQNRAKGMIIDLRYNPGGALVQCYTAASSFVPNFNFYEESRHALYRYEVSQGRITVTLVGSGAGRGSGSYQEQPGVAALWNAPVAVLVNRQTASCGEAFALTLQHYHRATVIGEPTDGIANTVTELFSLPGGGGLSVAVARSLFAPKDPYPARVTPNLLVSSPPLELTESGKDPGLAAAISELDQQTQSGPQARP
jgi:carboxyl-terminal processing protease